MELNVLLKNNYLFKVTKNQISSTFNNIVLSKQKKFLKNVSSHFFKKQVNKKVFLKKWRLNWQNKLFYKNFFIRNIHNIRNLHLLSLKFQYKKRFGKINIKKKHFYKRFKLFIPERFKQRFWFLKDFTNIHDLLINSTQNINKQKFRFVIIQTKRLNNKSINNLIVQRFLKNNFKKHWYLLIFKIIVKNSIKIVKIYNKINISNTLINKIKRKIRKTINMKLLLQKQKIQSQFWFTKYSAETLKKTIYKKINLFNITKTQRKFLNSFSKETQFEKINSQIQLINPYQDTKYPKGRLKMYSWSIFTITNSKLNIRLFNKFMLHGKRFQINKWFFNIFKILKIFSYQYTPTFYIYIKILKIKLNIELRPCRIGRQILNVPVRIRNLRGINKFLSLVKKNTLNLKNNRLYLNLLNFVLETNSSFNENDQVFMPYLVDIFNSFIYKHKGFQYR